MDGQRITIEMGETQVSRRAEDRLVALGLGACVGVCLYDPTARLAAMAHVVLPETRPLDHPNLATPLIASPGKCADTAVPYLVAQIVQQGGHATRLRAAIAGGAQIFSHSSPGRSQDPGASLSRLEVGPRNAHAVRAALQTAGIPLLADDTGGHFGRTVTLCVATGEIFVRRIGAEDRLLASLGRSALTSMLAPAEGMLRAA
jgi:chemotaxis protein CheD